MTIKLPITTGSAFPLLALTDAQRLASRARMRLIGKRDSGFNAFAAAIAALKETP